MAETQKETKSNDYLSVNPDVLATALLAILENPQSDEKAKESARSEFRRILREAAGHETFMNN